MRSMTRLHNDQEVDDKCKHMTHGVSMLNNIFLLHIKTYNYHLKHSNVLLNLQLEKGSALKKAWFIKYITVNNYTLQEY
jgi:hypothetical protein